MYFLCNETHFPRAINKINTAIDSFLKELIIREYGSTLHVSLARPAPHTLRGKRVWSNSHVALVFNTPQFL